MSGRRRSRSAGMPTMTRGGETGIVDGPDSRSLRSFGGMPSSTLRASRAWRRCVSKTGSVGRLNTASDPSPEVELPVGLGPDLGLPVRDAAATAVEQRGGGGSLARAVVLDGPDGLLRLRKDLADRDAELSAGLQNSHPGLLEREVVPVGPRHEPVQDRIVEGLPPIPVVGRFGAETRVPGLPEAG